MHGRRSGRRWRKEPGSERAHHSRVRPAGTLRCVRRQSPASEQPFGHAPTSAACSAFKSTAPAGSAQHSVFSRRNTAMQLHRSAAPALQDRIGLERSACAAAAQLVCVLCCSVYMLSLLHTNVRGQRTRHSHQPHITAFHQPAHSWSDTSWPPQPAAP